MIAVICRTLLIAAALLVATPGVTVAAGPAPAAATQRFEALLRAIDVAPTRADLERGWSDARARLVAAARDAGRDDWTRIRATSILTLYPDTGVRAVLLALATDARPAVRGAALYTAARTFGAPGDAALVSAVEAHLNDPDGDVRERALRGLRWVDHPAAEQALARLAKGEDAVARLAARTLTLRAARLSKPRH